MHAFFIYCTYLITFVYFVSWIFSFDKILWGERHHWRYFCTTEWRNTCQRNKSAPCSDLSFWKKQRDKAWFEKMTSHRSPECSQTQAYITFLSQTCFGFFSFACLENSVNIHDQNNFYLVGNVFELFSDLKWSFIIHSDSPCFLQHSCPLLCIALAATKDKTAVISLYTRYFPTPSLVTFDVCSA